MSQQDFLEKLFMSRSSVGSLRKYENGEQLPDMDTMCRMCDVFDCDFGFLVGDYEEKRRTTSDICKLTGLTEKAAVLLQEYKDYLDYDKSLSILLESDNFVGALSLVSDYKEKADLEAGLCKLWQEALSELFPISYQNGAPRYNYPQKASLLRDKMLEAADEADLYEYKIDTNFRYILQEIRRKAREGAGL